ncbi:MAG: glycine cleavage system protein R [Thiohalomonadales bacterium]
MNKSLVISALGNDKPGLVNQLSKDILDQGGNISESRMMVLGGEFAIMLLITGNQDCINTINSNLEAMGKTLSLTIIAKETQLQKSKQKRLPYQVQVVSMDHPGIVHNITDFLSSRNLNIEEIETKTYPAAHTGTPMFSLDMTISVPADSSVKTLRDEFIVFCDDLNLDASLESKR